MASWIRPVRAIILCLVLLPPAMAEAKNGGALPALLQVVERKYAAAETLTADFVQVTTTATGQTKTTSGIILAKRPDKVRWETLKPDQNLMISDGKTFWFYTPPFDAKERGQVIERKASESQSKLADALLNGKFSTTKDVTITEDSAFHFTLRPRKGTAGTVVTAGIEIDPDTKLIQKVSLTHRGGNRAEITLSKIVLGSKIEDDKFVFHAPADTDRLDP